MINISYHRQSMESTLIWGGDLIRLSEILLYHKKDEDDS